MKAIISALILLGTPLWMRGSSPHPIMVAPMHRVLFREATPADALEFLRSKGTELLNTELPPKFRHAVLIFEYRFDPSTTRNRVVYDRTNVKYYDALKDICGQLGLTFEVQSIDRIAILDAVPEGSP